MAGLVAASGQRASELEADVRCGEWVAPARAARRQNPLPAGPSFIAKGKDLFVRSCVPCHGLGGTGDGSAAIALDRKPADLTAPEMSLHTDGAIFWKIAEGNPPMPSFRKVFSDEQRWELVDYVRTLTPKASSQAQILTNRKPKR